MSQRGVVADAVKQARHGEVVLSVRDVVKHFPLTQGLSLIHI